jgi:hypothetical protein
VYCSQAQGGTEERNEVEGSMPSTHATVLYDTLARPVALPPPGRLTQPQAPATDVSQGASDRPGFGTQRTRSLEPHPVSSRTLLMGMVAQ